MNVAYRWFLGLRLTDKVFDARERTDAHRLTIGVKASTSDERKLLNAHLLTQNNSSDTDMHDTEAS